MEPVYSRNGVQIFHGDALEVLKTLPDESVDSVVTDPPYGISFMSKEWDRGIPSAEVWREVKRVSKPGTHLLAFGGTRSFHRLACAIEDAGWEIRDCIMWVYGSGFPKSLDVSKAIDKAAGAERDVIGQRTYADGTVGSWRNSGSDKYAQDEWTKDGSNRPTLDTKPATESANKWNGWGTALKPAYEPIIVARKTLIGTVAENVLTHGTGALNIDACRIPTSGSDAEDMDRCNSANSGRNKGGGGLVGTQTFSRSRASEPLDTTRGRWPANLIHDGSEEVVELFPHTESGNVDSAARFFYCAKASGEDRGEWNTHPTVKPQALMRYLVTLSTPPGGTVLDMFLGSGTTAAAAIQNGCKCIGIELNPEYITLCKKRLKQGVLEFSA